MAMKRLMLVDDSRAVRLAARRMLALYGWEILEAEHGTAALEQLRQAGGVDVILLDWNMPVMDGLALLQAVRADRSLPQPKIVMCTTENERAKIVQAIQAGADEYIMKPFTEEIIREKLEGVGAL